MRIAFLTPEYVSEPKYDGGLANYIYRVVHLLIQEGHEPEVFVSAAKDERIFHEDVAVYRCAPSIAMLRLNRLQRKLFRRPWIGYMDYLLTAHGLARGLSTIHRDKPYDIVEASNFKGCGLLVYGRDRPPLVTRISFRAHLWDDASGRAIDFDARLRYRIERWSMCRSDLIYGPCRRIAKLSSEEIRREVRVIHPPLCRSVEKLKEDNSLWRSKLYGVQYVLFFGRICKVKGVDVLAQAMRPILEETPSLSLVLVGREENNSIMTEVRAGLGEQVGRLIHLGRQPHALLLPILRHADLVVLPSRVDNFPNVCIETMLQGRLVIGTKNTGFEDLIKDGETGLLAEPGNAEDLARKVRQALDMSAEKKEYIRNNALQKVESVDPRSATQELVDCYEKVIGARRSAELENSRP